LEAAHFDAESGKDLEDQKESEKRCDTGCYQCLLNYSNQFDHEMIDRKQVVDLLLKLRDVTFDTSPTIMPRAEHLRMLKEKCESDLERFWLDFLVAGNYALPTDAQIWIEDCETRPDFVYHDRQFKCLIYVDGPPHDSPERQRLDKKQTNRLHNAGWEVIRFHHQDDWGKIVKQYSYLFGDGQ
jgi:very-short-patch-repair endonuclease